MARWTVMLCLTLAASACGDSSPDDGSSTSSASGSGGSVTAAGGSGASGPVGGGAEGGAPPIDPMPIKSVVVIVKENHTLDNYFTNFPGADTATTAQLSTGERIVREPMPDGALPCDVSHSNASANLAYAGGDMDGFDLQGWSCAASDPVLPFRYFTEEQLPNLWAYAHEYVLCDRFFSTLKGPTTPGHLAVVAGETPFFGNTPSSEGCSVDPPPIVDTAYNRATCQLRQPVPACFDIPSVVDHFPSDRTWLSYGPKASSGNITTPLNFIQSIGGDAAIRAEHFRDLQLLLGDLEAGEQADLVFAHVYSGLYTGLPGESDPEKHDNSEHALADPCWGENYTVLLVNAIMQGPRWNETAILVTYDDYGGFYDHVAPPLEACATYTPGFRLPLLIISPYAKSGFVLHKDFQGLNQEHASIPKLIEDVFGLPRMQAEYEFARDGQAGSLLEAFDLTQAPREPLILSTRECVP